MHLPELPLRLGLQGGLGRQRRVGVEGQGVVPEVEPDLIRILLHDLVQSGDDAAAERTLKVRERDDVDLGGRGPAGGALEGNAEPLGVADGRIGRGALAGDHLAVG